jgi:hypothetical protein
LKVHNVRPDGDLEELEYSKSLLTEDKVIIFTDAKKERIYIWKGENAPVRKRFAASRAASRLRVDEGLHFKVVSIDPGDNNPEFQELIGKPISKTKKPLKKEVTIPEKPVKPKPKVVPKPLVEPREFPTPTRSRASQPAIIQTKSPPVAPPDPEIKSDRAIIEKVLSKLKGLEVPAGYKREVIIIGENIYAITERQRSFFGKVSAERDIEQLVDPPEGTFFATDYTPRVIIENGEILAIEFLKGTPSKIQKKKGEYLTDLVNFFQGIGKPSAPSSGSADNDYLDKI